MRWEQGRSVIDAMLGARDLERVPASTEHAAELIGQAGKHVASARRIAGDDPAGACQLLYDAARKALSAILENQGLRATSRGGHIAVLEAVSAQLDPPMGKVLRPFDRLRRQRNNTEYPRQDTPRLTAGDVTQDIPKVEDMLDLARRVIGQMSPY
ncbi:MAG TPA: HEPN domain-containing protein [Streptosporangiaceae bacterium]|nr:HEPN domain-containing protein [Streptosporangiaceae bacterium]